MALSISDIEHLFITRGAQQYGGEAVSQIEHALQCAELADEAGESDATVAACLLHDLGHLLAAQARGQADEAHGVDDLHQFVPMPFLRSLFDDAVLEPIRLHVDAKRYLCTAEPGYWDTLSPASKASLILQGGPLSEAQAQAFEAQPYWAEAARLRRYDDLAKVPHKTTRPLGAYLERLKDVVRA
jgi:phosphonate degradation associated HDIG domain protein